MKIVIALGGNALGNNPNEQLIAVKTTAKNIADLIVEGHQVIVAHGNGPQVGMIQLAFDEAGKVNDKVPYLPLSLAGAMSQGYIGLHLQQAIQNELKSRGIKKEVASVITQAVVDKNDDAFKNPTKPIGSFYSEEEAKKLAELNDWVVAEDSGRGWRRMVPSPKPINILEKTMIMDLIDSHVVIAGGGGGIPTIETDNGYESVDAVIDKDFTSEKIAELVDADMLMIVTATTYVALNYEKPNQEDLKEPDLDFIKERLAAGEWPAGSMGPKVEASVIFAESKKGREAIITSLDTMEKALKGESRTLLKMK